MAAIQDFNHWRQEARQLLIQQIHPSHVNWSSQKQAQLYFGPTHQAHDQQGAYDTKKHLVPADFMKLARAAACYRDNSRWSLLYSLLWRIIHEQPHLLHLVTDPEVRRLRHMCQAIRRDTHKMHAFVRFKLHVIEGVEWYVSWFEPSHLIVPNTADFFVKRFNTMNWSILTPDACAHWDQNKLQITPGSPKPVEKAEDVMDAYWQQYYRHIFNPARLKTQAMQSEMPKKYWDHLPEAALINQLTTGSGKRTQDMLQNQPNDPNRLRNKSKRLRQQQDQIRQKNG